MSRPIRRSSIALAVVLAVVLAVAVPAFGAPPRAAGGRPTAGAWSGMAVLGQVAAWLTTGWVGGRSLPAAWGRSGSAPQRKWGCSIDPNGACKAAPSPAPTVDWGCGIDPNGACQAATSPAPTVDWGCSVDPDGHCAH